MNHLQFAFLDRKPSSRSPEKDIITAKIEGPQLLYSPFSNFRGDVNDRGGEQIGVIVGS